MCGRFTLFAKEEDIQGEFSLPEKTLLSPRYNIAPSQDIPIILLNPETGIRHLQMALWGFLPPWVKDPSKGPRPINARAETLREKPYFRRAFSSQRCLIPATGFYEWDKSTKPSTPLWFHLKENHLFSFAGLWSLWRGEDPYQFVLSCTLITTNASQFMKPIHDRMPVLLSKEDYETWLNPKSDHEGLLTLLETKEIPGLSYEPMNPILNSPQVEGESYFKPL